MPEKAKQLGSAGSFLGKITQFCPGKVSFAPGGEEESWITEA